MKNKKLLCNTTVLYTAILYVVVLCASVFTGCSNSNKENNDYTTYTKVPITNNSSNTDISENVSKDVSENVSKNSSKDSFTDKDADSLLSNCDVDGSVVEFSNTGCVISPTKYEGNNLAISAVPGFENKEDNITIHYSENCQFQLAKISIATGKLNLSDTDISNIKKQTSLIIYGQWSDEHNIEAARVIIARYE